MDRCTRRRRRGGGGGTRYLNTIERFDVVPDGTAQNGRFQRPFFADSRSAGRRGLHHFEIGRGAADPWDF